MITLCVVVALGAATVYLLRAQSTYAAESKIVVGQGRALFGADVSNAVQPFTQTMTELIQSNIVARQTIDRLGLDMTPTELIDNLTVTNRPDAAVLLVEYVDDSRAQATRVLGTVGQVFTQLVDEELARGGQTTTTTPAPAGADVPEPVSATVFDPAHPLPGRVSPRPSRTIVVAIILGLIAGILLALMREALSNRIRSVDDAVDAFGADVIGLLPTGTVGTTPAQIEALPPKLAARVGDPFQLLAATLRFVGDNPDAGGVVTVTSAEPGEGKSTVVAHVSAQLARGGHSVIAVEADLRLPSLHRFFDLAGDLPGITDVIGGVRDLDGVLRDTNARGGPSGPLLLTAGTPHGNPAEVLTLGNVAQLIARLRELADYVVVDTPPLLLTGDAFPFVQLADNVVVVCREAKTPRDEARAVREQLAALDVRRFSVVMTESSSAHQRAYGYGADRPHVTSA